MFDLNLLFFWICVLFGIKRRPPIKKCQKKKLFLELFLTLEMPIALTIGACLLRNHQAQKRVHLGKQLECQIANKNDLQSKSVMKKIVFKLAFYI